MKSNDPETIFNGCFWPETGPQCVYICRYINDEAKPEAVPYLEKRNELVRTLDPDHVTYSVEDTGESATLKLYRNTSTLFGVDPYPCTRARFLSVFLPRSCWP